MILNQPTAPVFDGAVARQDNLIFAHNFKDGQHFFEIESGMMIRLYEDEWIDYRVTEILETQALPPDSLTPMLFDGNRRVSYAEVFNHDLVLQTCIYKEGDLSWGRLFIFADRQR
jgi:hypothetical protein